MLILRSSSKNRFNCELTFDTSGSNPDAVGRESDVRFNFENSLRGGCPGPVILLREIALKAIHSSWIEEFQSVQNRTFRDRGASMFSGRYCS
jgi:hypothetical protein